MKIAMDEYKEKQRMLEEAKAKRIEEARLRDAIQSVNSYLKRYKDSDAYFTVECSKACCLIPNEDLVGNAGYEVRNTYVPYILAQKILELITNNNLLDITENNCYDPNYTQFETEMIVLVRHKPKETKSDSDCEALENCLMSAMKNDQRKSILKNMLDEAKGDNNDEEK